MTAEERRGALGWNSESLRVPVLTKFQRINDIYLIPDEGFRDNRPDPTERSGS